MNNRLGQAIRSLFRSEPADTAQADRTPRTGLAAGDASFNARRFGANACKAACRQFASKYIEFHPDAVWIPGRRNLKDCLEAKLQEGPVICEMRNPAEKSWLVRKFPRASSTTMIYASLVTKVADGKVTFYDGYDDKMNTLPLESFYERLVPFDPSRSRPPAWEHLTAPKPMSNGSAAANSRSTSPASFKYYPDSDASVSSISLSASTVSGPSARERAPRQDDARSHRSHHSNRSYRSQWSATQSLYEELRRDPDFKENIRATKALSHDLDALYGSTEPAADSTQPAVGRPPAEGEPYEVLLNDPDFRESVRMAMELADKLDAEGGVKQKGNGE